MKTEFKEIRLGDYIELLTDYHSGGSYQTMAENTKILHKPDYAVMIRTLNFERNDFQNDLIYCDKKSYDFLEYCHISENDILMNKIANPGSVYIMPKVSYKTACGMNLFLLRFKGLNQRYVYYLMKNQESYIKSKTHGSTTKTITKDDVRDLVFNIHASSKDRDNVEHLLTSIDKKIENNNRINDNLSQSIKTLFDYWFTQFEFPNASGKPYKSTNGAFTYNQDLKKDIPNGWQVIKLSTIADVLSGFAFSTNDYVDNGIYNLLTIKNVQDDGINIKFDNHLNQIPNRMPDYCSLKIGDILISLTGNVGRVGIVYTENNLLNQRVAKIQPKSQNLYGFIYAFLKNDLTRKKIETLAIGSSQANLSPLDIENQLFAFDAQICQDFSSKVKPLIDKYISNCIENTNLINLRDCLLPLLMNGQVTITE